MHVSGFLYIITFPVSIVCWLWHFPVLSVPTMIGQSGSGTAGMPRQLSEVTEGHNVTLQVDFTLPPNPYPSVTWRLGNEIVHNTSSTLILFFPSFAALLLTNAQTNQSGVYSVTFTSSLQVTNTTDLFNVSIQGKWTEHRIQYFKSYIWAQKPSHTLVLPAFVVSFKHRFIWLCFDGHVLYSLACHTLFISSFLIKHWPKLIIWSWW